MRELLRVLMFLIIAVVVVFTVIFLKNQDSTQLDIKNPNTENEIIDNQDNKEENNSGELSGESFISSGDIDFISGDTINDANEKMSSGDSVSTEILSGDTTSGDVNNNLSGDNETVPTQEIMNNENSGEKILE